LRQAFVADAGGKDEGLRRTESAAIDRGLHLFGVTDLAGDVEGLGDVPAEQAEDGLVLDGRILGEVRSERQALLAAGEGDVPGAELLLEIIDADRPPDRLVSRAGQTQFLAEINLVVGIGVGECRFRRRCRDRPEIGEGVAMIGIRPEEILVVAIAGEARQDPA
jgi:hypothetical protein